MIIPKKIMIAGMTYHIKRNCILDDGDSGNLCWDDGTIQIKKGLCDDAESITVLHEIIHGIDFTYMNGKLEEHIGEDGIDVLANAMYQIIPQIKANR